MFKTLWWMFVKVEMIDGCAVLWGLAYFLTVETVKEAYQRFFSL
jgi:hypothetical protein